MRLKYFIVDLADWLPAKVNKSENSYEEKIFFSPLPLSGELM